MAYQQYPDSQYAPVYSSSNVVPIGKPRLITRYQSFPQLTTIPVATGKSTIDYRERNVAIGREHTTHTTMPNAVHHTMLSPMYPSMPPGMASTIPSTTYSHTPQTSALTRSVPSHSHNLTPALGSTMGTTLLPGGSMPFPSQSSSSGYYHAAPAAMIRANTSREAPVSVAPRMVAGAETVAMVRAHSAGPAESDRIVFAIPEDGSQMFGHESQAFGEVSPISYQRPTPHSAVQAIILSDHYQTQPQQGKSWSEPSTASTASEMTVGEENSTDKSGRITMIHKQSTASKSVRPNIRHPTASVDWNINDTGHPQSNADPNQSRSSDGNYTAVAVLSPRLQREKSERLTTSHNRPIADHAPPTTAHMLSVPAHDISVPAHNASAAGMYFNPSMSVPVTDRQSMGNNDSHMGDSDPHMGEVGTTLS